MIEITNIKVTSFAFDRVVVSWEIADTKEEVHDYTISIARSESAGGPWETLVSGIEDRYSYLDGLVDLRNRYRQFWYRLSLTKKDGGDVTYFEPVTLSAPIDLIAAEVQARERLYFQTQVGRKMLLLPVRSFGQKCHCYDKVMGKAKVRKCKNCFGTTYLRGYLNPIVIWVQRDPSTKSNQLLPDAKTQQVHSVGRTGNYPPVKPDDVLVEAENRRWRVVSMTPTERLTAVMRQEMQLVELMQGSIEFEVPIDQSVFDVATEERHFSRPSTL